jgi:8-oxo-dGTP pyrophosphatase MutT (NUDIX family)
MPEPWTVVGSRITYQDRWLKVRSDSCRTLAGQVIEPYHVLEYPTWINVVALTPAREIVLAREYRHGAGRVLTGLPSGAMDPADATPEQAARRELREETGYTEGEFFELACDFANPANQDNLVRSFLALDVRKTDAPSLDPGEDIEVIPERFDEFLGRFRRREFSLQVSHAAAVMYAARFLEGHPT